jgi:phage baseplate assembly protein W
MSYHNTTDGKSSFWKDVDLTFSKNTEHNGLNTIGDITILEGTGAMTQSLSNIILTIAAERVFDSSFGSNVSDLMFGSMADQLRIELIIKGMIKQLGLKETRIEVQEMSLSESDSVDGGMEVNIQYRTLSSSSDNVFSTTISLYRVR